MRVWLRCRRCEKDFLHRRSNHTTAKYCSKKCQKLARRIVMGETRTCKVCGKIKPYADFKNHTRRKGDGVFYKRHTCSACYYKNNRVAHNKHSLVWSRRRRATVIHRLGRKCDCCGEDILEFMAIDHVGGGGNAHRRALSNRSDASRGGVDRRLLSEIQREGYPRNKYRILCHNCNHATAYGRICPHVERQDSLLMAMIGGC